MGRGKGWLLASLATAGAGGVAWLWARSEARASTLPPARPLPSPPPTQLRPPTFAVPPPPASVPPQVPVPKSVVTSSVNFRRTMKEKWRGANPPADILHRPKFIVGEPVKVVVPVSQGGPDPLLEGKTAKVTQLIWSEVQAVEADGTTYPLPEPGRWGYVLDLAIEGVPVVVDGSVLQAVA